jgi:hypothetical protein
LDHDAPAHAYDLGDNLIPASVGSREFRALGDAFKVSEAC